MIAALGKEADLVGGCCSFRSDAVHLGRKLGVETAEVKSGQGEERRRKWRGERARMHLRVARTLHAWFTHDELH